MITNSLARLLLFGFVMVTVAGCGTSSPSHFYTLDATATSEGAADTAISVVVGPVSLPASVDRPQFVIQLAPNQVSIDEFHRWAAPLDDNIVQVIAGNLAVLLGTSQVARAQYVDFTPTYRVTIDIQRFESIPEKTALIDALWSVRKTTGGQTQSGHTLAREPVQGKDYDSLAAAHSRALLQLSRDIAAAIQAEQSKKP